MLSASGRCSSGSRASAVTRQRGCTGIAPPVSSSASAAENVLQLCRNKSYLFAANGPWPMSAKNSSLSSAGTLVLLRAATPVRRRPPRTRRTPRDRQPRTRLPAPPEQTHCSECSASRQAASAWQRYAPKRDDLHGGAVRRGARHGALDAVAEEDLHAADDDGRVPDAIKLWRTLHVSTAQRMRQGRSAPRVCHRTSLLSRTCSGAFHSSTKACA